MLSGRRPLDHIESLRDIADSANSGSIKLGGVKTRPEHAEAIKNKFVERKWLEDQRARYKITQKPPSTYESQINWQILVHTRLAAAH